MNQYEFIKANITQNELDIRKNLIDSYQLKEENYPNSNALIEDLEKLEQTTIDFLVSISSHPFWLPQNYSHWFPMSGTRNTGIGHVTKFLKSFKKLQIQSIF